MDIIKSNYPEEFKSWLKNASQKNDILEIELRDGKRIPKLVLNDFDESLMRHYRIRFFHDSYDEFLSSHYLQLMLRSSLAKKGLIIANGVGVIDLDYKDEIKIAIHNPITEQNFIQDDNAYITDPFEHTEYKIKKGDRIAQITLLEHRSHLFCIESDEERKGGFGSTGG